MKKKKALDKLQDSFLIKSLSKLRTKGNLT